MKHFRVYRKLILIAGTVIAAISAGAVLFMESTSALMFLIICAFAILCGLLFLLDFLHNRYHDDLLEQITLLIEALVEQQERIVFPENEDTLTARLQHQLLKLRNILTAQNQMLAQEKEQIKIFPTKSRHPWRRQIPLHSYWMTKNCPMKNAANILPLCRLLLKS